MAYAIPSSRTGAVRPAPVRRQAPAFLLDAAVAWIMCGSYFGLLGPIGPLMMMSGALGMLVMRPASYVVFFKAWPLLLVALIGPLSAVWSTEPALSFRYGLQLAITVFVIMIAVAAAGEKRLVRGTFIAAAIVLAMCILSGRVGQSQGGYVLIGILGSKNAMGSLCLMVITTSLAVFFGKDEPRLLRWGSVPVGLLGLAILMQTFATGAVLGTIIWGAVAAALVVASRLTLSAKFFFGLLVAVFLTPLVLLRGELTTMWNRFLVDVLHKDVGLTGRDYLWVHADRLISEEPILGHGFRSTWLGSSSDSIGLLRWANIPTGMGFNFHNTFRDILVDFGFVGATVIFAALGFGFARFLLRAMTRPTNAALVFFAAMGIVMIVRSYVENLFGAFGESSLVVIGVSALGYLLPAPAKQPLRRIRPQRAHAATVAEIYMSGSDTSNVEVRQVEASTLKVRGHGLELTPD